MKYIRTKDGELHFNLGETKNGIIIEYNYLGDGLDLAINYDAIEKQADSIEELCDEFVCDHNNGTRVIQIKECKPQFPFCEDTIDYFRRNNQTFYGAIWTDKGLIYVAKMNDKGELELL